MSTRTTEGLTSQQRDGIATLLAGTAPAEQPSDSFTATHMPFALAMTASLMALLVIMIAAVLVGSVDLSAVTIVKIITHRICGDGCVAPSWTRNQDLIVADTRLPRVLLAAVCGAGLSMAGMVIQALVRNALAGPGILGVSSGAATGAVVVLRFGSFGLASALALNLAAFAGALIAMVVVFALARVRGRIDPTRLILAGVAISLILKALTSLMVLTAPDQLLAGRVLQWTLGGFGGASWDNLLLPSMATVVFFALSHPLGRLMNLSLMGDDAAISLGLDIARFRAYMMVLASLLVALIIAVSGEIAFVGLMLPHITRLIIGSDHRKALPLAAVLGAVFMVAADLVARRIAVPIEIPVGIVTSLVGGPVFIALVRRRSRSTP